MPPRAESNIESKRDELRKLLKRAERGDHKALPAARALFHTDPGLWREIGDLAAQAEKALVKVTAGENLLVQEAVERAMESLRSELAGPNPTPLDRLLVDRVVACWLQVHYADAVYAQGMKDLTFNQGDYYQRRQDRAHRRYLSAIRSLAQVRRLLSPSIQVNIAKQQINQQVLP